MLGSSTCSIWHESRAGLCTDVLLWHKYIVHMHMLCPSSARYPVSPGTGCTRDIINVMVRSLVTNSIWLNINRLSWCTRANNNRRWKVTNIMNPHSYPQQKRRMGHTIIEWGVRDTSMGSYRQIDIRSYAGRSHVAGNPIRIITVFTFKLLQQQYFIFLWIKKL